MKNCRVRCLKEYCEELLSKNLVIHEKTNSTNQAIYDDLFLDNKRVITYKVRFNK